MKFRLSFFLSISLSFFTATLFSQAPAEDILLKAMQDEIARNMTELKLPDFEKPFFMMYGIVDQKNYTFTASLGSLTRSTETHDRYRSTARVLVGDYSFNDESLDDDLFSESTSNEIDLPLEDDYWGIRRSFWSTTDKVYRDAAKNLAKNKESLKETGKKLEEIPHRTFVKSNAVTIVNPITPFNLDKAGMEAKSRKLSELFLKHPSIWNSGIIFNYIEGTRNLVSSEGSKIKVPFRIAAFTAIAFSKTAEGEQAISGITHFAATPDKLPDDAQLAKEIEAMILHLENQSSIPKFTEEYSGPVLLMGQSVAEVFAAGLFSGNMMASDNIPKLTGLQYDNDFYGSDSKIGKPVLNESISVIAKPTLKTFNGVDLLGSFDVDDEGIVPSEVTVIEKGVLKNLLNNRTITGSGQTANGYASGPGVLQVNIASKESEKSLKKKLIDKAKKQGLAFAIIIRSSGMSGVRLLNVYKVNVADGKEELVRGAALGKMEAKTLKHISGASEKYQAYNVGNFNNNSARGGTGLTSFIVPDAVLVDEMDVNRFRLPSIKETDYVKNPLE